MTNHPAIQRRRFYARSMSTIYDTNHTAFRSRGEAESVASLYPQGYVSNRPPLTVDDRLSASFARLEES